MPLWGSLHSTKHMMINLLFAKTLCPLAEGMVLYMVAH